MRNETNQGDDAEKKRSRHRWEADRQWRITDTEVPVSQVWKWWLKIAPPILLTLFLIWVANMVVADAVVRAGLRGLKLPSFPAIPTAPQFPGTSSAPAQPKPRNETYTSDYWSKQKNAGH